ncbi:collagen-like protein [Salinibacterium sp. ZJ450]|uniref:collagen-like triple helix repeat-containing protein n=1 Tax=Salinibacterium sp. ZJ450 TaxID=2708338 RepID=UPI00141FCDD1|nr:collagen-like protein [Salinibacterium sp. ZJ450]
MTDDANPQGTPPASPTPPDPASDATATTTETQSKKKPAGVTQGMLIWVGIAVVVLSFVAAFLGSWLARSVDSNEAVATPTPTPTSAEIDAAAFEEAIKEILPAGSAVRAGTGVPESGKGYEGDVYIDISNSNVYLFQDGDWTQVGNIRTSAAENLTGTTGPAGETGATGDTGATGETGAPGAPGTQVLLGVGEPDPKTCTTDGDIYIDTTPVSFYECDAGDWTLFGPPTDGATPTPEPTEPPAEG